MVFDEKPSKYLLYLPHWEQQLNNQKLLLVEMLALQSGYFRTVE